MEQGSAENSSAASSEQNKQSNFVGPRSSCELSQVVHLSPQGCANDNETGFSYVNDGQITKFQPSALEFPNSSQNKQANDAGPSLLNVPFAGELLAPSEAGNEDLFAVYLKGISHSREQQMFQQENQVPKSTGDVVASADNQLVLHASNNQVMNNSYLDHLSNLPTESPLPLTLSKSGGQWSGASQISAPYGNFMGDSTIINTLHSQWATQAHPTPVMHGSSVPLRLLGINQGIPSPMNVSSGYNFANSSSGFPGSFSNYGSTFNMGSGSSYRPQNPVASRQKRKMPWQEDLAPIQKRWNSIVRGDLGQSSRSFVSSDERFTLYDKRYEEIGLPLDPHLRIFNASKGNGGAGGST
ncbi:uncharacterized protein LOC105166898 [Sesamum indicum]|uniref:Uncharacterized protein LOC105166898 n=1 Tax=Sesamum indicum TaxID=4182 RepID=A0A6I9TTY3_SESIN|nr:uncharacterized protein LOC105166898 [Sesamum indicum]